MTPREARRPRPLSPSEDALRALTMCARTSIGRIRGSRAKRPTVSIAALRRIEAEIGARLHDDLLVLLAVRDPVAKLLTGIESVTSIADAADEDDGVPEGWVCVSRVYSDPVGELVADHHGAAYTSIAAEREPRGETAKVLVATDGHWDNAEETTLGAFIDAALHEARSGEVGEAVSGGGAVDRPEPLEPIPKLVAGRKLALPTAGEGGRVVHPKFGVGDVLRRIPDGDKVVVRFDDRERTLLARFVKPHEP